MTLEWTRLISEWTNRVLSLYRDNTWFVQSYLIWSIHESFSKLGVIPKKNCVQSLSNEAKIIRNDLRMYKSGVVSLEETTPDSFSPTSFGPFTGHSASWVSFESKIVYNLHWVTYKWTEMTSECTNRVLSLLKRQHPIRSFLPHFVHSRVIQ